MHVPLLELAASHMQSRFFEDIVARPGRDTVLLKRGTHELIYSSFATPSRTSFRAMRRGSTGLSV
jgi:hypothetical protein